jgi:type IV pilus assembly protein PilE
MTAAPGTCGTADCYVLAATPVAGDIQASDDCGALTLDNVGNKGWTGSHPPTNGNCW